jgi:hypothetical protein
MGTQREIDGTTWRLNRQVGPCFAIGSMSRSTSWSKAYVMPLTLAEPDVGDQEPHRVGDDFLTSASACLWEVARGELPSSLQSDDQVRLSARRLLEAGAELCDGADLLQRESLHRPAHTLLRALLEAVGYVLWLAVDPVRHWDLLSRDETPPFRNVLERIGWGVEYERTYGLLSEFVHPTEHRLHMYRKSDFGTADGLLPEIQPDGEIYLIQTLGQAPAFVSFAPMDSDEAEAAYGLYVRAKGLDVVLAGLLALYNERTLEADWWPTSTAERFVQLIASDTELASVMLTRSSMLF